MMNPNKQSRGHLGDAPSPDQPHAHIDTDTQLTNQPVRPQAATAAEVNLLITLAAFRRAKHTGPIRADEPGSTNTHIPQPRQPSE